VAHSDAGCGSALSFAADGFPFVCLARAAIFLGINERRYKFIIPN